MAKQAKAVSVPMPVGAEELALPSNPLTGEREQARRHAVVAERAAEEARRQRDAALAARQKLTGGGWTPPASHPVAMALAEAEAAVATTREAAQEAQAALRALDEAVLPALTADARTCVRDGQARLRQNALVALMALDLLAQVRLYSGDVEQAVPRLIHAAMPGGRVTEARGTRLSTFTPELVAAMRAPVTYADQKTWRTRWLNQGWVTAEELAAHRMGFAGLEAEFRRQTAPYAELIRPQQEAQREERVAFTAAREAKAARAAKEAADEEALRERNLAAMVAWRDEIEAMRGAGRTKAG